MRSYVQNLKTYIHNDIVRNLSLQHAIHPLKSIAHRVKTYIHYDIVYNLSLNHDIHALKSIAHMENQKNMERHSHRNVYDEKPYTKNIESHCTDMHDKNSYTTKW